MVVDLIAIRGCIRSHQVIPLSYVPWKPGACCRSIVGAGQLGEICC